MIPPKPSDLSDLVANLRTTHHVTTRALLHDMTDVVAGLVASAGRHRRRVQAFQEELTSFRDALLEHLIIEEQGVFPYVLFLAECDVAATQVQRSPFATGSPLDGLVGERAGAEAAIAGLEAALARARPSKTKVAGWAALENLLARLRRDLAVHAQIEEECLYPVALAAEERLAAARAARARFVDRTKSTMPIVATAIPRRTA